MKIKPLKVATIVGTRPEIIRLSRTISFLNESPAFDNTLIHTGQNYDFELNKIFFDELKISSPDYFLDASKDNPAATIGEVISKTYELLQKTKPDAVLILGDTNSCLAALSAKRLKIPIFHIEAGNRCFDQRVPEEINRKIVDHISDINLTYSSIARDLLISEGINPDTIIKIGSPMYEVLESYNSQIESSEILKELGLAPQDYFLLSSHREENIDNDKVFNNLMNAIEEISKLFNKSVIVSTHPRTRIKLKHSAHNILKNKNISFHKPFGFFDYCMLQKNAKAVLSDSGTISEESSILNFPALNIREAHERHEAMEEGAVMMVGNNIKNIINGLQILSSQRSGSERDLDLVKDYYAPSFSKKVARIILSYTDFVNLNTWKKY